MNIDDLTIGEAKALAAQFGGESQGVRDNGMIGRYVIVRCRDAGVHAGELVSHAGRECVLKDSRRLWYWKPAEGQKFLSGVAVAGLHEDSKVGAVLERLHLTENCEIILCSDAAAQSIKEAKTDES